MRNITDNCTASFGFDRSSNVVMVRTRQARINRGSVFRKAKVVLTNFRLAGQINRIPFNSGFFAPFDAVERRYRQFSAATLHADMLDKPALNGRGFARCSNRLLQGYEALPIDLATSERNSPSVTERLFHTANAVKVK